MSALAWLVPLLPAAILHEAAHAYAARALGDDTAARMGRCTLNPLPHMHLLWTAVLPMFTHLCMGIVIAFAKPVMVDYYALGRRGAYVALAGPAANLLQAGAWAAVGLAWPSEMATIGVLLNVGFAAFNLLPIEPFDGWRALRALGKL